MSRRVSHHGLRYINKLYRDIYKKDNYTEAIKIYFK